LRLALVLALGDQDDVAFDIALGPLDRDGAVTKVFVFEDAADGSAVFARLGERAEYACDLRYVFVTQLLALAA
jgi:hypothetical protein